MTRVDLSASPHHCGCSPSWHRILIALLLRGEALYQSFYESVFSVFVSYHIVVCCVSDSSRILHTPRGCKLPSRASLGHNRSALVFQSVSLSLCCEISSGEWDGIVCFSKRPKQRWQLEMTVAYSPCFQLYLARDKWGTLRDLVAVLLLEETLFVQTEETEREVDL